MSNDSRKKTIVGIVFALLIGIAIGFLLGRNNSPPLPATPPLDYSGEVLFRKIDDNDPRNGVYQVYSYSVDGEVFRVEEPPKDDNKWIITFSNGRVKLSAKRMP